jgi:hypothetical protein
LDIAYDAKQSLTGVLMNRRLSLLTASVCVIFSVTSSAEFDVYKNVVDTLKLRLDQ